MVPCLFWVFLLTIELGDVQKAKLAAIESQWDTHEAPAPFTAFGIPDQENQRTDFAIEIPYVAGIIATRSIDEEITGLKDLIAQNEKRIRNGMQAYALMKKLQAGEKTPENLAKFQADFLFLPGHGRCGCADAAADRSGIL